MSVLCQYCSLCGDVGVSFRKCGMSSSPRSWCTRIPRENPPWVKAWTSRPRWPCSLLETSRCSKISKDIFSKWYFLSFDWTFVRFFLSKLCLKVLHLLGLSPKRFSMATSISTFSLSDRWGTNASPRGSKLEIKKPETTRSNTQIRSMDRFSSILIQPFHGSVVMRHFDAFRQSRTFVLLFNGLDCSVATPKPVAFQMTSNLAFRWRDAKGEDQADDRGERSLQIYWLWLPDRGGVQSRCLTAALGCPDFKVSFWVVFFEAHLQKWFWGILRLFFLLTSSENGLLLSR